MSLQALLDPPFASRSSHPAVVEGGSGAHLDYATLGRLASRLRSHLGAIGVGRGDRVGIYLRKSADSVASIIGILQCGAAYVPVDPTAPSSRCAYIHNDCAVKAVLVERRYVDAYTAEFAGFGPLPLLLVLETIGGGAGLTALLDRLDTVAAVPERPMLESAPDDLAYILYTSGSTGHPKGVALTHHNALSFIRWCTETFSPRADDVFSSHAPFHFDLSILDLYLPLAHGATLVLIPEEVGKEPIALSSIISRHRITVWYSAPSILGLLAQYGKIAQHDYSSLRLVLFAGEVFPVVHLRSFKAQVAQPRYFNLYGPTETNVCTFYEIPKVIASDRIEPYPIGRTCSTVESRVVAGDGSMVAVGTEGELCIAGSHVMKGYWHLAELTDRAFISVGDGQRWYKTGDIVIEDPDGNYRYVGRRDRQVKKRGYRVELGEIEACLYAHAAISEAAVVALQDDAGVKVKAHLSVRANARPSVIDLKTFCSQKLPLYMVPDLFAFHDVLPKTSTDKIDYVFLKNLG